MTKAEALGRLLYMVSALSCLSIAYRLSSSPHPRTTSPWFEEEQAEVHRVGRTSSKTEETQTAGQPGVTHDNQKFMLTATVKVQKKNELRSSHIESTNKDDTEVIDIGTSRQFSDRTPPTAQTSVVRIESGGGIAALSDDVETTGWTRPAVGTSGESHVNQHPHGNTTAGNSTHASSFFLQFQTRIRKTAVSRQNSGESNTIQHFCNTTPENAARDYLSLLQFRTEVRKTAVAADSSSELNSNQNSRHTAAKNTTQGNIFLLQLQTKLEKTAVPTEYSSEPNARQYPSNTAAKKTMRGNLYLAQLQAKLRTAAVPAGYTHESYTYQRSPNISITKQQIPKTVASKNTTFESFYIYHCDGATALPEEILCDGIRHCEHGEDELHCAYRAEGCGDWFPHDDYCLKATFALLPEIMLDIRSDDTIITAAKAQNACEEKGGTLAALRDRAGRKVLEGMIARSGFNGAVVGAHKAQPVSHGLSHLYRFLWQWGDPGDPIAYDLTHLQRTGTQDTCSVLDGWSGSFEFKSINCLYPEIGYICMRPNPNRAAVKRTLPGIAFHKSESLPSPFPTKTCPDGSLVQTFHSCRWGQGEEALAVGDVSANQFSLFHCRFGQTVHYSLLCDGKKDCADGSDETDCRLPRFSALLNSSFTCRNFQSVPQERRCDGMPDCLDGSDEDTCIMCRGTVLCSGVGCLPISYSVFLGGMCEHFDADYRQPEDNYPAKIVLDGYGLSEQVFVAECEEGFHQCVDGYCIPSFLLNNGEQDCPRGEDEGIPVYNMTCPGYYRCHGTGSCVHQSFVCDGVHHCPDKDDELFCNLTCPQDSGCVCEGQAYKCSRMINPMHNLHLRYLDLSGASDLSFEHLYFMEYLVFLNLSSCGLVNVTVADMAMLQTLDLSFNLLTHLSSLNLRALPGMRYLDLSNNPVVEILNHHFTDMLRTSQLQNLQVFVMVNVSVKVIDSGAFGPLSKLVSLDLRRNPLREFTKDSLRGLEALEELYTDDPRLCCTYFHPSVSRCHAPVDELSSCSDLLGYEVFRVCLWALAALAVVGNLGVMLYRSLRARRTSTSAASILVQNLCASDLLMGVYLAMIGVADAQLSGSYVAKEGEWRSSRTCAAAGFLSLLSSEVSALVVSLITVDRVLVLCFPFRPQLHLTPRTTLVACLGVWVAGLMLAVIPLVTDMEFYGQTGICIPLPITRLEFSGKNYAFGVFIILNFVIFLFIAAGQSLVYWAVHKASVAAGTQRSSKDLAIARRLFLVVLTDFCCWFPVGLMGLLAASGTPISSEVNVWAAIFVLPLNSALNPFLYTLNGLREQQRRQRKAKKMKKIVGVLQTEIPRFSADRVLEVMRICLRSGLVDNDALERVLAVGVRTKQDASSDDSDLAPTSTSTLGH